MNIIKNKTITQNLMEAIYHDLRDVRKESVYVTSKESGLRAEVINKLESVEIKGSAESLCRYIDSYCRRFPSSAYKMLYNLSIVVAQAKITFNG